MNEDKHSEVSFTIVIATANTVRKELPQKSSRKLSENFPLLSLCILVYFHAAFSIFRT